MSASDDALEYIRKYYRVPAFKGAKIKYKEKSGEIRGGTSSYLLVRLEGEKTNIKCHPTWNVEYLENGGL
jgi:hypothetical protein